MPPPSECVHKVMNEFVFCCCLSFLLFGLGEKSDIGAWTHSRFCDITRTNNNSKWRRIEFDVFVCVHIKIPIAFLLNSTLFCCCCCCFGVGIFVFISFQITYAALIGFVNELWIPSVVKKAWARVSHIKIGIHFERETRWLCSLMPIIFDSKSKQPTKPPPSPS